MITPIFEIETSPPPDQLRHLRKSFILFQDEESITTNELYTNFLPFNCEIETEVTEVLQIKSVSKLFSVDDDEPTDTIFE